MRAALVLIALLVVGPAQAQFLPGSNVGAGRFSVPGLQVIAVVGSPMASSGATQVQLQSSRLLARPAEPQPEIPSAAAVRSIYPNPASHRARVAFEVPAEVAVRLTLFDLLGRRVLVVLDETLTAGGHERIADLSGLQSGVYLYRFTAGPAVRTGTLTVVR